MRAFLRSCTVNTILSFYILKHCRKSIIFVIEIIIILDHPVSFIIGHKELEIAVFFIIEYTEDISFIMECFIIIN